MIDSSTTWNNEDMRRTIRGEMEWRRCPDCGGDGESWFLHWVEANDPNEIEQDRPVSAQFAADFLVDDWPDYSYGEVCLEECYLCGTIGYLPTELL
jgi:hypothetical protein